MEEYTQLEEQSQGLMTLRHKLVMSSHYRSGNRVSERASDLPKVTQ